LIRRIARKYKTFRQMTGQDRPVWARYHLKSRFIWARHRLKRNVVRPGIYGVYLAIYLAPGLVLAAAGFRFMPNSVAVRKGLGDLLRVPASYMMAIKAGFLPRRRWVMLAPGKQVANFAILDYWRRHFIVIQSDWLCLALAPFTQMPVVSERQHAGVGNWRIRKYGRVLRHQQAFHEIGRAYAEKFGNSKVLELSPEHEEAGWKNLSRFGVPRDAWWVVIHAREAGYHKDPAHKDFDQTFRNGDIRTYKAAVEHIVERGGWVIRVGDPGMSHLPKMERVIDYVHTDMFCDWMDLFLSARCRFMLGTSSGVNWLPWLFGHPVAMVNYICIGFDPDADSSQSLYILKHHWSEREQRLLSFTEVMRSPLKKAQSDRLFAAHHVRVVDNTPEEVLDLAKEMFEVLDGKAAYTEEDERRQQRFVELRHEGEPFPAPTLVRVGREFLRKYDGSLH